MTDQENLGSPPDAGRGPAGTTTGPKASGHGDLGGFEDADLPGPGGGRGVVGGDGEIAGAPGRADGADLPGDPEAKEG